MGSDCEVTDTNTKNNLEQVKIQTETDLKTAISQLRKCEDAVEGKLNQMRKCASNMNEINSQLEVETDSDKREELNLEKKEQIELEDHLKSALRAEKELMIQSKVTITALNKKLYEIENELASAIEKEMMDMTTQRKCNKQRFNAQIAASPGPNFRHFPPWDLGAWCPTYISGKIDNLQEEANSPREDDV